MKHILLRFFLIFACVAIPLHSHACWDDSYDDYYDYDDYDDDDWDWDYDDWDWNDNDDDDIVYGEIDESNYDMNGGELDEVVVTPDTNDSNDDDWWRTDYGDDDDYGNDDEWFDDYGDDPDLTILITGTEDGKTKEKYELKQTDKLVKALNKMPKTGFKQGTTNSCLFAGLTFTSIVFGGEIPEGKFMMGYIEHSPNFKTALEGITSGLYYEKTIESTIVSIAEENGFSVTQGISDIKDAINDGQIVLTNINDGEKNTHDIVIVGYNENGYIGYDTDRDAGFYRQISSEEIKGTYTVGLKK